MGSEDEYSYHYSDSDESYTPEPRVQLPINVLEGEPIMVTESEYLVYHMLVERFAYLDTLAQPVYAFVGYSFVRAWPSELRALQDLGWVIEEVN